MSPSEGEAGGAPVPGGSAAPVVAGMVVETLPGRCGAVASRIAAEPGLEVVGDDRDRRLAVVWTAASGRDLEDAAKRILHRDPEIVGIYPTLVGRCDGAAGDEVSDAPE